MTDTSSPTDDLVRRLRARSIVVNHSEMFSRMQNDPDCTLAADTIESLRASLTRVEEERDEAERVLERISGGTELDEEWFAESPPIWAQDDFNGNSAASCGYCGSWHEVVRPGKTQCPCCGDGQDKAAIAAARLRETRLSRANAAQE